MIETTGLAVTRPGGSPERWAFPRRDPLPDDVVVRVTHCGVCATDLHVLRGTDPAAFPVVAGHEMTGVVSDVGSAVGDLRPGDRVAVGNIVGSCGECPACLADRENDCARFPTLTYGGADPHLGGTTRGGFSATIVVDRRFTYALPDALDPAASAPLLCAGVTTFAPLRRFGAGPGTTVGVVGIGGLGHLAVRYARAMGARVVAFTTSAAKSDAARALGAHDVVLTRDAAAMAAAFRSVDLLLDTTGVALDLAPYLNTLAVDGTYVLLGIPTEPLRIDPMSLVVGEKRIAGSGSGGVAVTREMLDFSAAHAITADVEVLPADRLDEALDRLARGDVRFRFVLDLSTL
ncbi:NAD(P)-dependent alcohol dehydrogenase [Pseudonocardia sp. HH130630-07]|uniref:NAD(P)-dependent alcohol dehydrogenase n=1 Tax=Pseudonocardia sp. HH130630-07 TaxID=1690815 RepID=UPI0008152E40|nr:NAD(P)-dependent alcohol dehydrogenase [Pseudonocardia sp. HH130630-07]ANY08967.1 alcohol dehydrogenase [Pseudonocardia sp. HH130630-07]